jgi:hypothetical protein
MMWVRRQAAIDELDAPAIDEFAARRDSNEHRRATILDDPDARASLLSSRHVFLLRGRAALHVTVAGTSPDSGRIYANSLPKTMLKLSAERRINRRGANATQDTSKAD